jgi:Glycine-zipper domain
MSKRWLLSMTAGLFLAGCSTIPTGPSVMVLPGNGKTFERFQVDDAICRQWALRQTGVAPNEASNNAAVGSAAVGAAVGAATGAAIGAASGNPGTGAAVGSGIGLLGEAAAGAGNAERSGWSAQRRYDTAYMQCMYAKGNQIPLPAGTRRPSTAWSSPTTPEDIPPPPPGSPPPPPPG